jgi:membrane fusion protein, multidrug efflux system
MRYVAAVVGLLVLIGVLAGIKGAQIGKLIQFGKAAQKAGPPPEAVSTTVAGEAAWESTLLATGTVAAVRGVSVSNDAAGVVTAVRFESGAYVKAGQVLVELDSSVEQAQLVSAEARKELAAVTAGRSQKLLAREAIAPSQVDNDLAQVKTSSADSGQFAAQIARKTIRAPFSGWLGIRNVNLGQYLNPGTAVTTLEQLDSVYVDFTLPQQRLVDCHVGQTVRVHLAGSEHTPDLDGIVRAIDPGVDSVTRTIKVRANVANGKAILRSGMFVEVTLPLGVPQKVVIAPVTSVMHASYGDSVYVVEEPAQAAKEAKDTGAPGDEVSPPPGVKLARQHFVKIGQTRGDFVSFTTGVKVGDELVTAGGFKLRNNSPVRVDNTLKMSAAITPTVDNH